MRLALLACVFVLGCGAESPEPRGLVRVYLSDSTATDALQHSDPLAGARSVNVTLEGVDLVLPYGQSVALETGRELNLLDLGEGTVTFLGAANVAGTVTELRVRLGREVTVTWADGTSRMARLPAGARGGVRIVGAFDPSSAPSLTLDFDAAASVQDVGGELVLRPVIRATLDGAPLGVSEPMAE